MEEFVLDGFGGGMAGLAAGGGSDDGEELDVGEGCAGDVEALGVGTGVRWGEEESVVVGERVEKGAVGGGEAFEKVSGAEGEAQPEPLGAGTGEEGAAGKALWIDGVGEVEVADVADSFDVVEGQGDEAAGEVEEVDRIMAHKGRLRQIAGEGVSGEASNEDFFG